ncbi:MAG: AI-2E family transporter [Planctomycetota bacterium]|jgi:predicted PurR-regulated permease PerM
MSDSASTSEKGGFDQTALLAIRLGLVLLATYWCYRIVAPFVPLVLWGAILAVAIHPVHGKLTARLGNRRKLSAVLITLLGLVILTAPVVVLTESLVVSSMDLATQISEGSVRVPPPADSVREWPVVGEKLYSGWLQASENLGAALTRFGPQLAAVRHGLVATAGGASVAFLQMFASIIIAGVFLAAAEGSLALLHAVLHGLVGKRGARLLAMSTTTVRSVTRGVLGVAVIESILAAIGLMVAGIPAAGFWAFVVLVLSIVQVPPLLPLIPLIVYAYAATEPFGATVLLVCSILAVLVDTFLKPVLLGQKADSPMLIVLLGAIGGMMLWGIVGLFVGAVILALSWEGLQFWIVERNAPATEAPSSST